MIRFKACERCNGDVTIGKDWHGDYIQCLQCGWYKDTSGDPLEGMVTRAMDTLREQMEQRRAS